MARRENDFYETPPWMTRALLAHVPEIGGKVMECCAGDMSIARILTDEGGLLVHTNDIDKTKPSDYHYCASDRSLYGPNPDWVITNPPFGMPLCTKIVANAIKHAVVGVAMMLRISFEEPTAHTNPRGPFLEANPLTRKLVMPRHSFTGNGKSDSATTAWMIWSRVPLSGPPMLSLYRADEIYARPLLKAVV
jgi:hypothetical protein